MRRLLGIILVTLLVAGCAAKPNFVLQEKTVIDQNTGLTWARNANLPGKQLIWRGDDNVYEYIKRLNESNYAGYADWRVPNKDEFEKLIDYAKQMGFDRERMETWPYQKLRQIGFIEVRDYDYWTATRQSPTEIWTADMASGLIRPKTESKPYYLWPIRGTSR
jgi:Protein of unknown function (DUF1566)